MNFQEIGDDVSAHIGTLDLSTRVLLAVGDAKPVEVGIIEAEVTSRTTSTHDGAEIAFDGRRWRRHLALGFLRMAWAVWWTRDETQ